jgi:hypothetical protein
VKAGILISLMLGMAAPAQAQADVVHRVNAGELDASGWVIASSAAGAFSVKLPCLYREVTRRVLSISVVHKLDCRTAAGVEFTVSRNVFRNGKAAAKHHFDTVLEQGMRRMTIGEMPAAEGQMAIGGLCAWSRVLRAGPNNNVLLTAVVPSTGCDEKNRPEEVSVFFDSIEVRPL